MDCYTFSGGALAFNWLADSFSGELKTNFWIKTGGVFVIEKLFSSAVKNLDRCAEHEKQTSIDPLCKWGVCVPCVTSAELSLPV